MKPKEISYLPFHVINEFMVSSYRLAVLQWVLERQQTISPEHSKAIHLTLKSALKVPGFRNASLAPLPLKIRNSEVVFEKSPDFTKHVLAAWAETHPELAEKAYAFLVKREWKVLPLEFDRSRVSGFLPTWPKNDDFEVVTTAFLEEYPEYAEQSDDATLMLVWICNRLPVDLVDPMDWEMWDLEEK
jgi:hypothetical protein